MSRSTSLRALPVRGYGPGPAEAEHVPRQADSSGANSQLEETEPSIELGTFLLKLRRVLPLLRKLRNQRTQRKIAVIR